MTLTIQCTVILKLRPLSPYDFVHVSPNNETGPPVEYERGYAVAKAEIDPITGERFSEMAANGQSVKVDGAGENDYVCSITTGSLLDCILLVVCLCVIVRVQYTWNRRGFGRTHAEVYFFEEVVFLWLRTVLFSGEFAPAGKTFLMSCFSFGSLCAQKSSGWHTHCVVMGKKRKENEIV